MTIARPLPQSDRILARLMALHPKKIDLSLGRMQRLLDRLDNPERRLPPVFHVAGTNGKGSTCAYLRAMLEAGGYRVHVYTSPHLVRFAERIRLAGRIIDEDKLVEVLELCEQANGPEPVTFFEVTTAAAILAFANTPADAIILEVGLGGRLDATNVVDHPLVTAITPVSIDHEEFLGQTIARIATEKAGIAKQGTPLVVGTQEPAALDSIKKVAQTAGASVSAQGPDWQVTPVDNGFLFTATAPDGKPVSLSFPDPALIGPHQIMNAGLAVACILVQSTFPLSHSDMAKGLQAARWPARLQDITQAPGLPTLPTDTRVWLDGGHNPSAGKALGQAFEKKDRPLYLVSGLMANKDAADFFKALKNCATALYTIDIPGENCHPAAKLAGYGKRGGLDAQAADDLDDALQKILSENSDDQPFDILICGSLYLAGYALAKFNLLPD